MKIRTFLPYLFLTFSFLLFTCLLYAQEEVLPDTVDVEEELLLEEELIEEEVIEEEVIEEEVIEEELLEEEVIEEEIIEEELPEEEVIEEELPEEEIFEEEVEEVVEEEPVEEAPEEQVTEEVSFFAPGWGFKAYVNLGLVEPWGDPGTGAAFDMGFKGQLGAQINPAKFVSLPAILSPLSVETLVGYTKFNHKSISDVSTAILSFSLNGRYDVTDLILQYIGFEYPALGIFGFIGFQVNSQSWDFPNREFDSVMAFGSNLGLGVKFNLMNMIGQPVEIDLRFTQMNFLMGDVEDKAGAPIFTGGEYSHGENGFLLGLAYPF